MSTPNVPAPGHTSKVAQRDLAGIPRPPVVMTREERLLAEAGGLSPETIGEILTRRSPPRAMDADAAAEFLEALAKTGVVKRAAMVARISSSSVYDLAASDEEFAKHMEEARQEYLANLDATMEDIAFKGTKQAVFDKDGKKCGVRRIHHAQVILAVARRHNPAYREKFEHDVRHSGGVMVVTAPVRSEADWAGKHGAPVIDVQAVPVPPLSPGGR